jgi:hypothetical protein
LQPPAAHCSGRSRWLRCPMPCRASRRLASARLSRSRPSTHAEGNTEGRRRRRTEAATPRPSLTRFASALESGADHPVRFETNGRLAVGVHREMRMELDKGPRPIRSVRHGSKEVRVGLDEHVAVLDGPDVLRIAIPKARRVARTGPVEGALLGHGGGRAPVPGSGANPHGYRDGSDGTRPATSGLDRAVSGKGRRLLSGHRPAERDGGGRQVGSKARPIPPAWLWVIPPPPRTLSRPSDRDG